MSCVGKYDRSLSVLFLFFWLAERGESRRQRAWIPNPICQIPPGEGAYGPEQLVRHVVEVNRGAGEHPHPNNHYEIQSHVQNVEHHPRQRRQTGCLQGGHRRRFLHDEEGGVGQDERVPRDVVAVPVVAGSPAGGFVSEALDELRSVECKTGAGYVLDVEEGLGADVPHGGGHHQRQQPPAEEGHAPVEGGVGEEEEGSQQQQGPTPGQLDKVPVIRRVCIIQVYSCLFYQLICSLMFIQISGQSVLEVLLNSRKYTGSLISFLNI